MANELPDYLNFEINFTDVTLLEANGEYIHVKRLMEKPVRLVAGIYSPPPSDKWVVKSNVTIIHELGYAQMICDFYHDGRIVIVSYVSTNTEMHRPDIRCLSHWAQQFGWKVPEPHPGLVRTEEDFWKMQWETYIVESDFLTEKHGTRLPSYVDDGTGFDDPDEDDDDHLEEEIQKL